jgi:hypothetical protein
MSLCIRSIQWCTADGKSSNGSCSYYDRARCFSGLTEMNSQLIVSCLQLSVKRHVQEAHECEAAELSHDLFFELIKAGLFAEALCAFVELCLNGHGRPVSSVDLQTRALVFCGLTREASVCELIIRDRPTQAPLRALLKLLATPPQCGIPTFTGGTCSRDVKIKMQVQRKSKPTVRT